MRILIVTKHIDVIGGVEKYLSHIIHLLLENGHQICFGYEFKEGSSKYQVVTENICPTFDLHNYKNKPTSLKKIVGWDPELIFHNGLSDCSLNAILNYSCPVVFFCHDYTSTCPTGGKRFRFPHRKTCSEAMGLNCLSNFYLRRCGGLNGIKFIRDYIRALKSLKDLRNADNVLVASSWMLEQVSVNLPRDAKIFKAPYFTFGFDTEKDKPRWKNQAYKALFGGRIVQDKGWSHALKSVKKASEISGKKLELLVVGDGPDLPRMRDEAHKLKVETRFFGWLDDEHLNKVRNEADFLIFPSIWPEPFGLMGIESARMGLPSVGYLVGGVHDWLVPGETGEAGPPGQMDPKYLVEGILKITSNMQYFNHLRVGAWRNSLQFKCESHVELLEKVFKEAIGNRN